MNSKHIILIALLVAITSQQLLPVQTEEEVVIDISTEQPTEIKGATLQQNKQYNKLYEIDKNAYEQIIRSFKNVVHLSYEKDTEQEQAEQLNKIIAHVNFTSVDVIFVKSPKGLIEDSEGVWVKHFDQVTQITDLASSGSQIMDIISPKIEFLQTEDDVDQYLSDNKLRSLVLLPQEYKFSNQIIEDFEYLLRNGEFYEAKIESIKGYHQNYKNFTAPTLLLSKGNGVFEQYEYNLTYTDQILDFFYLESLDLVSRLGEDNYARVFGGSIQTQVHLLVGQEFSDQLHNDYFQVALNNKLNDLKYHRLIFTYSTYQQNPSLWDSFDFNEQTQVPKLVITETNFRKYQLQKYICQSETLDQNTIQQFIDDFRAKNLTKFYKSEPIPEVQEGQKIFKIVGNTFSQEVLNKGKNVLILFWDSKNEELFIDHFQLLNEFSEIQNQDRIKIGHIDLAKNEHPKITVDSVPKMLLYLAADKKSPKEYLKSSNLIIPELKAWLDYYIGEGLAYKKEKSEL